MKRQTARPSTPAIITVPEACQLIGNGVSPRVFYQWVAANKLPPGVVFRPNRRVHVIRARLLEWLSGAKENPAS